jgi:hypothetical protein
MHLRTILLPLLLTLLAACAPPRQNQAVTPGPSFDISPVGTFQYQLNFNDPAARRTELVSGNIRIMGEQGNYTGSISGSGTSEYPITNVNFAGQDLVILARTPDGPVTLMLTFTGDSFSGYWEESNRTRHAIRGSRR